MATLPIVRMGNPVLRTPAIPLSPKALAAPAMQQLIDDMVETMHDAEGVGLAAPQIGLALRLFVYQADDEEVPENGIPLCVAINPTIEPVAGEPVVDWEGCLSIPDLRGLVPRHAALRLRAMDRHGVGFERALEGFEARIVQHELDHLDGVLFLDRMPELSSLAFLDEWQGFLRGPADFDARDKAE
ncbi:MAG: peptide deformylase [Thermoanaerobaculia bacterium]